MSPADIVGPTLHQSLTHAARLLKESGAPASRLDADLLLAEVLGVDRHVLYLDRDRRLTPEESRQFQDFIQRRCKGENVAYIRGRKEFFSLTFRVNRSVLIPRPETELLVELALSALKTRASDEARVLDVGTGSGCIPIAIAANHSHARFVATDISADALQVARANSEEYKVHDRIEFIETDGFGTLTEKGPFDLILSNPPYVRTGDIEKLDVGIHRYEPHSALDGGPDGLSFYRREIPLLAPLLKPESRVIFEIGYDQADAVSGLLQGVFPERKTMLHLDGAGQDRVVELTPLC